MHAPLDASYTIRDQARDRREAFPLPMSLVCKWERLITRPACPLPLRLWLEGALLCVHASLRGDTQRIEWSLITLQLNQDLSKVYGAGFRVLHDVA